MYQPAKKSEEEHADLEAQQASNAHTEAQTEEEQEVAVTSALKAEASKKSKNLSNPMLSFAYFFLFLLALWVFLIGLGLMGDAFKALGGKTAGTLFNNISNPIASLMIGILATVLVQSSSTSTSVIVGLVASDIISVHQAIPMIMGANIGTSVTNTIVSMGHIANKDEFRRGFAGATVHDMFNYLSVLTLLPLELITDALNGYNGGYLEVLSSAINVKGGEDSTFTSPVKALTSFAVKAIISVDKNKIKAMSYGTPTLDTCIDRVVAKVNFNVCGDKTQYTETMAAWDLAAGSIIKGGALEGVSGGGVIALILSLVLLIVGLIFVVYALRRLVLGVGKKQEGQGESHGGGWFARQTTKQMHPIFAILFGMAATAAVQSSSIITSTLVPFVALGTISLDSMLPLTLGSNIGTTGTAVLAALAAGKEAGMQIALVHLLFNLTGILVWYPLPLMRNVPLNAARGLGYLTVCFPWFAIAYLLFAFAVIPLLFMGVSALMDSGELGLAFGWIILLSLFFIAMGVVFWYKKKGGKEVVGDYLQQKYIERATDDMKADDALKVEMSVIRKSRQSSNMSSPRRSSCMV